MNMAVLHKISEGLKAARRWATMLACVAAGTLSVANGQIITNSLAKIGNGNVAFTNGTVATASGPTTFGSESNNYESIVATPANGYMFTGWSGSAVPYIDDTGSSGTNTWLQFMLPNATGVATFVQSVKLTVLTSPGGGTVTVNGNAYSDGTQLTVPKAATNDVFAAAIRSIGGVLYDFDHWEKQNLNLNFGPTANPNTISGLGTPLAIPVTLSAVYMPHVDTVQVTLKSQSNGTAHLSYGMNTYVAPDDKIVTVNQGALISLSAAPSNNYAFTGWVDENGVPVPDILTYQAGFQQVTMSAKRTFRATFKPTYTVTHHNPSGPATPVLVPNQIVTNGYSATVEVPQATVDIGGGVRYVCIGYTNFAPPPSSAFGATTAFTIPDPTNDYHVTWVWGTEYRVSLSCPGRLTDQIAYNGINAQGIGVAGFLTAGAFTLIWVAAGSPLTLTANVDPLDTFVSWTKTIGATVTFPTANPLQDTNNAPVSYSALFVPTDAAAVWYNKFGLSLNAVGDRGPSGDPDGDGLNNATEYQIYTQISNTMALASRVNPLNSDSEGDGIDDSYEYFHIPDSNNVHNVGVQLNSLAMVTTDGDYGPNGNPDSDFHWDTTTGHHQISIPANQIAGTPLSNIEEYTGPDGAKPYIFTSVAPGGSVADPRLNSGYVYKVSWGHIPSDPAAGGIWTNTLTKTVVRMVPNGADTGDSSFSDTAFTGNDAMDDGFKWSWDFWQSSHTNTLISNTNIWPGITNMVPNWNLDANRLLKPSMSFVEPGSGAPSYDVWYNPADGRRGNLVNGTWVTVMQKYGASAIATANIYPMVRYPVDPRPWCLNPFLWDTDGDGLPDGWEITFGYDPWAQHTYGKRGTDDGHDDPSGSYYADDGTNRHYDVYLAKEYDPRTAYGYAMPQYGLTNGSPYRTFPGALNTKPFINLERIRGDGTDGPVVSWGSGSGGPYFPGVYQDDRPTHPFLLDTDGDGMWDGWEFYVGLDPQDIGDAGLNPDKDSLSNIEEFQSYTTFTNHEEARSFVTNWPNKFMPSDPFNNDTDRDQIKDGVEKTSFNYASNGNWVVHTFIDDDAGRIKYIYVEGGGLNPCSADTDGDYLPDAWENYFHGYMGTNGVVTTNIVTGTIQTNAWVGGMDGTATDANVNNLAANHSADYDGDGLLNYQEYFTGAIHHWQYRHNGYDVDNSCWTKDRGFDQYDPYDFFNPDLSLGGDANSGLGGRAPYVWDPHYIIGPLGHPVQWRFITAKEFVNGIIFSSTDPGNADSDLDGMDDGWETFHGLNPLFGVLDLVYNKINGRVGYWPLDPMLSPWSGWLGSMDIQNYPWIAGYGLMDPDGDGLPNIFESVQANVPGVPYYHTDPSPAWMTDFSSTQSWVNLYYWLGNTFGIPKPTGTPSATSTAPDWYWDPGPLTRPDIWGPPSYLFSFEANEGFDSDSDNISDRAELVGDTNITTGVTDPLNGQSPIKRRALYLNGNAAVRTRDPHLVVSDEFRKFTAEAWVRPENPVAGHDQVVVERPMAVMQGSTLPPAVAVRRNFRIALDSTGRPYAMYEGAGLDLFAQVTTALALEPLRPNEWVHLACTYDGAYNSQNVFIGYLRLYKNGIQVAATSSSEIPANGWFDAWNNSTPSSATWKAAPMLIGAADMNPDAWVDGSLILEGRDPVPPVPVPVPVPVSLVGAPMLTNFFQGWVDNVAVWDGARSQNEIKADMQTRMTRTQVSAAVQNLNGTTLLKAYVTFDNRPDPTLAPVSPAGFQVLDNRPTGYANVNWWASAPDRSLTYDDYLYVPWIENMVVHTPIDHPRDTTIINNNGTPYPNTANPYGLVYRHASNYDLEGHPQVGDRFASTLVTEMEKRNATVSDFLPLRWARTDENVPMWDGGGAGTNPYDSDKDGLPDAWEEMLGLDPLDSTGLNGTYGDPDADGLNNWAEFNVGTSPQNWDSNGKGAPDFYDWLATNKVIYGERFTDHDYMEDSWELAHYVSDKLDPRRYDAQMDADSDGWSNYAEFMAGTDPTNTTSHPVPDITGTITYNGIKSGSNVVIHAYQTPDMEGNPFIGAGVGLGINHWSFSFNPNGMKEGSVYLRAFMDLNGNGSFDTDEPSGIAEGQPFNLEWSDLSGIEIPMTDNALGYGRFSWSPIDASLSNRVVISDGISVSMTRWISPARSFVDEQDFIQLGYSNGLKSGNWSWAVSKQTLFNTFLGVTNGGFSFQYPLSGLFAPTLVAPIGGEIRCYTRNTFKFAADGNSTVRVRLRVYSGLTAVGTPVYSETARLPYQHQDGYRYLTPTDLYFGGEGFGNGPYTWTLEGLNGSGAAALSAGGTFTVNIPTAPSTILNPLGPFMFSGTLDYYGKVTNSGNFVIEASLSPSFAGQPDGRLVIPNTSTAGAWPTNRFPFLMSGLPGGSYYLRAYLDQNANRHLDTTDTRGYLTSVNSFYSLGTIDVRNLNDPQTIRMSSADTDNDNIPDDWEIATTGGLGSMGVGTYAVMSAMSMSAFMTDLEWYRYGTMNLSLDPNAAGLDGIPLRIKAAFGMDLLASYQFTISGVTTDANGMPVVIWAKLPGDPVTIGNKYQILQANSVSLTYKVQYSQDLTTWSEVAAIGSMRSGQPVAYDNNAGLFRYIGTQTNCPRFYRVQISW